MTKIAIDSARCSRCGTCIVSCSESVFARTEPDAVPAIAKSHLCIACGHCLATCPAEAVIHEAFPPGTICPVETDALPSPHQVRELLRSRRSVRCFKDAPVSRECIEAVLDAARLAPSAHNVQDVQYVVVQDRDLLKKTTDATAAFIARLARQIRNPAVRALYRLALSREEIASAVHMLPDFDYVSDEHRNGRDPILHGAPCILLAHARRSVNFPETNAALALHNAALAAHALGLGGFLLGYVVGACKRDRTIPDLLGIPRHHEVYAGLALGQPAIAFPKWIRRKAPEVRWI